jgi:hypothetical protein
VTSSGLAVARLTIERPSHSAGQDLDRATETTLAARVAIRATNSVRERRDRSTAAYDLERAPVGIATSNARSRPATRNCGGGAQPRYAVLDQAGRTLPARAPEGPLNGHRRHHWHLSEYHARISRRPASSIAGLSTLREPG